MNNTTTKPKTIIYLRWMVRSDISDVLAIEEGSFKFPWFEQDFIDSLRKRNTVGMVAEHDNRVVGFMIYELHKTKLDLLKLCVDPKHKRTGIGTQMVYKMTSKLSYERRTKLQIEVDEYNLDGLLFLKKMSFIGSVQRDSSTYLMEYSYD